MASYVTLAAWAPERFNFNVQESKNLSGFLKLLHLFSSLCTFWNSKLKRNRVLNLILFWSYFLSPKLVSCHSSASDSWYLQLYYLYQEQVNLTGTWVDAFSALTSDLIQITLWSCSWKDSIVSQTHTGIFGLYFLTALSRKESIQPVRHQCHQVFRPSLTIYI